MSARKQNPSVPINALPPQARVDDTDSDDHDYELPPEELLFQNEGHGDDPSSDGVSTLISLFEAHH